MINKNIKDKCNLLLANKGICINEWCVKRIEQIMEKEAIIYDTISNTAYRKAIYDILELLNKENNDD